MGSWSTLQISSLLVQDAGNADRLEALLARHSQGGVVLKDKSNSLNICGIIRQLIIEIDNILPVQGNVSVDKCH